MESSSLVIRGARTHNLKNVDLTLPAGQLIVFTGVSGSGKSSLAFDTIYAEGQRRYVESLSAYARQFLERMEKPDVDRIDGICPSIAIRQKNSVRNPRSTVGTVTEIHDYMRLLFARVGRTICRKCGQEVIRETAEVVTNRLLALPEGTRLMLGFDLVVVSGSSRASAADDAPEEGDEPGESLFAVGSPSALALENLRRKGFGRLLVDGQAVAFEDVDAAALKAMTTLRVVVDRVKVSPDARTRITDSVETSYTEGGGAAWAISDLRRRKRRRHAPSRISSPSGSSAAPAGCRTKIRSRACSRSTTRSARARPAMASATSSSSIRSWWCPIRPSRSTRARLSRGPSRTTARSSPS